MRSKYIKGKYSGMKHFDFILLDMLAIIGSFVLAYIFKFHNFGFLYSVEWKGILLVEILMNLTVIFFTASFSGILRRYGSEELLCVAKQTIYNFILCTVFLYILKIGNIYSRVVVFGTYSLYFVISLSLRVLWKKVLIQKKRNLPENNQKSIFVVGSREKLPQLLRSINSGFFMEYSIRGICIADGMPGEKIFATIDLVDNHNKVRKIELQYENSTTIKGMVQYILTNKIQEVFIGVDPSLIESKDYDTLLQNGKVVHLDIQSMVGMATNNQFITTIGTYKALSIGAFSFNGKQLMYIAVKRIIDILFAIVGLIAMLPLMIIVKICYLASGDKESIFYTQTRVGLNGKPFKMYKFRSMIYNADEILQQMLKNEKYKEEWEAYQKFEKDPRITRIGEFLRKTSLDEIPQFINVLKGDMSLIGPRPLVEGELEFHGGLQLYNQVRPGVTGWWGCNGRSNTTYEERLELEYYYVKNCSFYLDALCVIKTIFVILKRDGAK